MDIQFGALIQRSLQIAWRYKSLWIFGLFAGQGINFNFDIPARLLEKDTGGFDREFNDIFGGLGSSPDLNWSFIIGLLAIILALTVFYMICYSIAKPAIIDAINKITRGGEYRFGSSFSRGVDLMWRTLGLAIVWFMSAIAVVILAVIFAIFSLWTLLLTIPAAVVAFFFIHHTFALGQVALVARDATIGDSIAEGWELLNRNKTNCLLMTFLFIGIMIGVTMVTLIVGLILLVPFILMMVAAGSWALLIALGVLIGFPLILVLGGFTGTFFNALYTQFYFKLYEPEPLPPAAASAYPTA